MTRRRIQAACKAALMLNIRAAFLVLAVAGREFLQHCQLRHRFLHRIHAGCQGVQTTEMLHNIIPFVIGFTAHGRDGVSRGNGVLSHIAGGLHGIIGNGTDAGNRIYRLVDIGGRRVCLLFGHLPPRQIRALLHPPAQLPPPH